MKTTRRNQIAFRSSAFVGGIFLAFFCFPMAAQADHWGFSFRVPFLGFYVGPYGGAYDGCGCPLYPSEGYDAWSGEPVPGPDPSVEGVRDAKPSNSTSGPQSSVDDRQSRRYIAPEKRVYIERPERTASRDIDSVPPGERGQDNTTGSTESDRSEGDPSDATTVQENRPESPDSLIPLTGVN